MFFYSLKNDHMGIKRLLIQDLSSGDFFKDMESEWGQ